MPATVRLTRLVLFSLFNAANTSHTTLLAALTAAASASLPQVLAGKQVIEAQAAGVVTKYQIPAGVYALNAADVSEMYSRLLDLYQQALLPTTSTPPGGGLTAESGGAPSATIYNWMLSQLQVIRAFSTDHSSSQIR